MQGDEKIDVSVFTALCAEPLRLASGNVNLKCGYLCHRLPLEPIQKPGIWARTCGLGAVRGRGRNTITGAIPIWVACGTTQGQGVVWAQATTEGHVWVYGPVAARVRIDTHGSSYHQGP